MNTVTSTAQGTAQPATSATLIVGPAKAGRMRAVVQGLAVLLLASYAGHAVGGLRVGLSVGAGVLLSAANLLALRRITAALAGAPGTSSAWGFLLPFKLIALAGVGLTLVEFGGAEPIPLAIGFALLPLTGVLLPRPSSVPRIDPALAGRRPPSVE